MLLSVFPLKSCKENTIFVALKSELLPKGNKSLFFFSSKKNFDLGLARAGLAMGCSIGGRTHSIERTHSVGLYRWAARLGE